MLQLRLKLFSKSYYCKSKSFMFLLAGLFGFASLFPIDGFAQGNLLITPRRAVFEGSKRSIDLNLANTGQDTATYSISLVQIRMKEDGGFETITEPDQGQRFADSFVRFFHARLHLDLTKHRWLRYNLSGQMSL